MISWKEYFKGKFYLDEMIDSMIFCDDTMVTSECGDIEPAREDMEELVKALNGEPYSHATFDNPYYNDDGVVYYTDKTDKVIMLNIRGWGYLTSSGLSDDAAAAVQDSFGIYIVDCMMRITNTPLGQVNN